MSDIREKVLVGPAELRAELESDSGSRPVLLDVRWALGAENGRAPYDAGHIPGAVYVDLEADLTGHDRPASEGRHPLPGLAELQESARAWGINDGDRVVAYDQTGGMAAARLWWLLRWAGVDDVRVLDGGYPVWVAADGDTSTAATLPPRGNVTLTPGGMPTLDAEEAAALARDGVLLDARAGERYRGEVEPIDSKAGHIPGAASAPTTENLEEGFFKPAEDLTARFAALGADDATPVGVYCGSGITAAHEALALASIGITAALYAPSWSGWSSDPNREVATGTE